MTADQALAPSAIFVAAGNAVDTTAALLGAFLDEQPTGAQLVIALAAATSEHERVVDRLSVQLEQCGVVVDRVTCAEPTLPAAVHAALPLVARDWTVVWPSFAEPMAGWWQALTAAMSRSRAEELALQPLVVQQDGTIASAGGRWFVGIPRPVGHLRDWPVEDALRAGDLTTGTPLSPLVAVRTADLRSVGGLRRSQDGGLAEVDLGARLAMQRPGTVRVVVSARVVGSGMGRHGFIGDRGVALETVRSDHGGWIERQEGATPKPIVVRPEPLRGRVGLRWALDTAAPAGARGERWGDVLFARSLAKALEARGQLVAVDTKGSRTRSTRSLDEVVVVLRGLDRCPPTPGAVNVLWVISHPDEVTAEECREFDLVFAASESWAMRRSEEWGVSITPLLQCTDPDLFRPDASGGGPRRGVAFVGNTRGGQRELVEAALEAGVVVALHGKGWDEVGRGESVVSEFVEPREVAEIYASSEVVLCDHWEDMRREGFISNRVFDVLATGTILVCDEVPGVVELAPQLVHTTGRGSEWAILRDGLTHLDQVPSAVVDDTVRRMGRDHSFDARARQLVDAVLATLTGLDDIGTTAGGVRGS